METVGSNPTQPEGGSASLVSRRWSAAGWSAAPSLRNVVAALLNQVDGLASRRLSAKVGPMKRAMPRNSGITAHRESLKRLVSELAKRPFDFLPERSVQCLDQFFSGYGIFGPPVWRDLSAFEHWLADHLFYPQDTGARWWRFIQLNAKDSCDSFELFCRLYSRYSRRVPIDLQPTAPDHSFDAAQFDFYSHLYAIYRRPGLYLGNAAHVQSIAAYLAGYFRGKKDARIKPTRDEMEFLHFEEWLRRHHKLTKRYPWHRLIEMWPYGGLNSLECFFAYYDAYLTESGKKARGLDDLFELVYEKQCTTIRRRKKLPKKLILFPDTKLWWRAQRRKS